MELICYAVKRPEAPLDIRDLRRDPVQAWRQYLGVQEPDIGQISRLVRKVASVEGVRCCCYRLIPSGTLDDIR